MPVRDAFEKLESPPGGLTRLRAALDEAERGADARARRWLVPASAIAMVIAVGVLSTFAPRSRAPVAFDSPSLVALGLEPASKETVLARDGTSVELVSLSSSVVFYRAGTLH